MGGIPDERVEAAARRMYEACDEDLHTDWGDAEGGVQRYYLKMAEAALDGAE